MNKYLFGKSTPDKIPKCLYLQSSHFPKKLLLWRKNNPKLGISTLPQYEDAQQIVKDDFEPLQRQEYINTMMSLMEMYL